MNRTIHFNVFFEDKDPSHEMLPSISTPSPILHVLLSIPSFLLLLLLLLLLLSLLLHLLLLFTRNSIRGFVRPSVGRLVGWSVRGHESKSEEMIVLEHF